MNRFVQLASFLVVLFLMPGIHGSGRSHVSAGFALAQVPATKPAAPADMVPGGAPKLTDYSLHDGQKGIDCDVVHLKVPRDWAVKGQVQWNNSVMMPGNWYLCAANPNGPELWIRYPGQTFVWRDNFNLLGVNFQLHPGDADPALGDEIERPLATATDCIKQVIVPRFRKDLAKAKAVSGHEMTPDEAKKFAAAVVPDLVSGPTAQQIQITPKGATMRVEYALSGQTVQEDIQLLVVYIDLPSNAGVVHVWSIPYCTSFRAAKGQLDAETESIAKPIDASVKPDAAWNAKRDDVVKQITQTNSDKLRLLAQAVQSDVIANMNRNIFDMTQQSYHRRMDMEQQTFHAIDNAIVGNSDYVLPNGQTIQAPMAPVGQSAWRDSSGQVRFFNNGVNPNGGLGQFQQMTEK